MRCANPIRQTASAAATPNTYEAELAAMNRDRVRRFRALREAGHRPDEALAAVNAATLIGDEPQPGDRIVARVHRDGSVGDIRRWTPALHDELQAELRREDPRTAITQRLPAAGDVL